MCCKRKSISISLVVNLLRTIKWQWPVTGPTWSPSSKEPFDITLLLLLIEIPLPHYNWEAHSTPSAEPTRIHAILALRHPVLREWSVADWWLPRKLIIMDNDRFVWHPSKYATPVTSNQDLRASLGCNYFIARLNAAPLWTKLCENVSVFVYRRVSLSLSTCSSPELLAGRSPSGPWQH